MWRRSYRLTLIHPQFTRILILGIHTRKICICAQYTVQESFFKSFIHNSNFFKKIHQKNKMLNVHTHRMLSVHTHGMTMHAHTWMMSTHGVVLHVHMHRMVVNMHTWDEVESAHAHTHGMLLSSKRTSEFHTTTQTDVIETPCKEGRHTDFFMSNKTSPWGGESNKGLLVEPVRWC